MFFWYSCIYHIFTYFLMHSGRIHCVQTCFIFWEYVMRWLFSGALIVSPYWIKPGLLLRQIFFYSNSFSKEEINWWVELIKFFLGVRFKLDACIFLLVKNHEVASGFESWQQMIIIALDMGKLGQFLREDGMSCTGILQEGC